MLRGPKEKFLADYGTGWKKLVSENPRLFEEAFFATLLELATDLPLDCAIPQQACDAHQQMAGARKALRILSSLHEPTSTTKPATPRGLDYSAGV